MQGKEIYRPCADLGNKFTCKIKDYEILFERIAESSTFIEDTLFALKDTELQRVAAWSLVKQLGKKQTELTKTQTDLLIEVFPLLQNWAAVLSILSAFQYIRFSQEQSLYAEDFVREHLTNSNTFVRAWALTALFELSKQRPDLQNEVKSLCRRAIETDKAAVKVRAKKILVLLER